MYKFYAFKITILHTQLHNQLSLELEYFIFIIKRIWDLNRWQSRIKRKKISFMLLKPNLYMKMDKLEAKQFGFLLESE